MSDSAYQKRTKNTSRRVPGQPGPFSGHFPPFSRRPVCANLCLLLGPWTRPSGPLKEEKAERGQGLKEWPQDTLSGRSCPRTAWAQASSSGSNSFRTSGRGREESSGSSGQNSDRPTTKVLIKRRNFLRARDLRWPRLFRRSVLRPFSSSRPCGPSRRRSG